MKTNYRGVDWHARERYYMVRIKQAGKTYHLKTWKDPVEAAMVYDAAAVMLHGPDAVLNFDGNPPPHIPRARIKEWLIAAGAIKPK